MSFPPDHSESPPPLKISFNMDIRTNGAKEGLIISTGIISGTPQMFNGIFGVNNSPLWPAVFSPPSSASTLPLNDKNNFEINPNKNLNESSKEQSKMLSPLMISLNEVDVNKQQPLNQQQLNKCSSPTKREGGCCYSPPPLLFDSTTTTTSLEIFRPDSASSSADFYQLPKAPLSQELIREPPVVLVPVEGEEYEFNEKSETHFSPKSANPQNINKTTKPPPSSQQKSVHWGESVCIQPSPIPSTSTTPSSPSSLPSSTNSFRCSQRFPIQMDEEINKQPFNKAEIQPNEDSSQITNQQPIQLPDEPIKSPTIIRRQRQQHFERRFSPSPTEIYLKCPPIPPKQFKNKIEKGRDIWEENSVPPLPPKPEHLKRSREGNLVLNQNLQRR
ncbi:unnamed protein product [Meloidogyne enterolobii]|uniref:Uncharacterized protein n=2 Tax=Meloidogyne enterolobii TaxID=390850 RepID=A0ACB1ART6_MELEN